MSDEDVARFQSRLKVSRSTAGSSRQEKRTAKELGGRRQPGSGNTAYAKGDVTSSKDLVECKVTKAGSYRLTEAELQKHAIDAIKAGKRPVYQLQFGDERTGTRVAVLDWNYFLELRSQE